MVAAKSGDTEGLIELRAADVVAYTDGGGKAQAARKPIRNSDRVARFMVGIARPERGIPGVTAEPVEVNGLPVASCATPSAGRSRCSRSTSPAV